MSRHVFGQMRRLRSTIKTSNLHVRRMVTCQHGSNSTLYYKTPSRVSDMCIKSASESRLLRPFSSCRSSATEQSELSGSSSGLASESLTTQDIDAALSALPQQLYSLRSRSKKKFSSKNKNDDESENLTIEQLLLKDADSNSPFTDEDLDLAYASLFPGERELTAQKFPSLAAPEASKLLKHSTIIPDNNIFLPASTALALALPLPIVNRIKAVDPDALKRTNASYDWDSMMTALSRTNMKLRRVPRRDVIQLITNMPLIKRAEYGMELIKMIEEAKIRITPHLYDLFVQAYANEGNVQRTLGLVKHMQMSMSYTDLKNYNKILTLN